MNVSASDLLAALTHHKTIMPFRHWIFVLMLPGSVTVHAADMYRWVDASGRTHFSDSVPEQYQQRATRINSRQFEPSPEERARAVERAARERARLAEATASPTGAAAAKPATGSAQVTPRFPAGSLSKEECNAAWAAFHKSQECFAPFVIRRGIRGEAALAAGCRSLLQPPHECGPSNQMPQDK